MLVKSPQSLAVQGIAGFILLFALIQFHNVLMHLLEDMLEALCLFPKQIQNRRPHPHQWLQECQGIGVTGFRKSGRPACYSYFGVVSARNIRSSFYFLITQRLLPRRMQIARINLAFRPDTAKGNTVS